MAAHILGYTSYDSQGRIRHMNDSILEALRYAKRNDLEVWQEFGSANGLVQDMKCIYKHNKLTNYGVTVTPETYIRRYCS